MNDPQIRDAFHRIFLREYHSEPTTLVVDELGLEHGKCRADIAVINGYLDGYEIKSDLDSLHRLSSQVSKYNAVFDHSWIILASRHLDEAIGIVPEWWGIILVSEANYTLDFQTIRYPYKNANVNDYSVAQLLWREEAKEILMSLGVQGARLKAKRAILYGYMVEMLESQDLRLIVREYLKKRQTWRHHEIPSLGDD